MTTTTKHAVHGVNFWISADFAQASDAIYANFRSDKADSPDWQLTPFQVADAQHDQERAAEMIADWGELTPSYSQIEKSLIRLGATAEEADGMTDILHTEGWGGDESDITDEVLAKKLSWYRENRA